MTHTKLTLCSLVALLAAGQAFAHTGVRDVATEGTASYNGFTITHGCGGDSGLAYPVLGQSALFPFGENAVWKDATGAIIPPTSSTDPLTGITTITNNGNGAITSKTLNLSVTGYAGFASPFTTSQEIVDANGTVQALFWKDGAMEPKLNAITPFKVSPPTLVDNCTRLKIRMGVINYCDLEKNAANDITGPYKQPKDALGRTIPNLSVLGGIQTNVPGAPVYVSIAAGNGDNNRADWWFMAPEGGSLVYNDPELLQPSYWTTMTVNNSAAQLATCPVDAAGNPIVTDITVEPNGIAFDTYLTGPNTHPFTKGTTGL